MTYVAVSGLTHPGLLRDHNEDSLVVGPWTVCAGTTPTPETLVFPLGEPVVVAVADGLGGHPAGDVASTAVARELARLGPEMSDGERVRVAVDACNKAVYDDAEGRPDRAGMGTTVAGVSVVGDTAWVFNVGDSRVYASDGSDGSGWQLASTDDSPPLAPGQRHTSVVTQTLGGHSDYRPVQAHVSARPVTAGSSFLVCTDGLTDTIDDDMIAGVLGEHRAGAGVFHLWESAMSAGGPDNITVALVEVDED